MKTDYDLIVIGAGAAGLVVASVAAQLGLQVLIVEQQTQMGGDCLHFGCVPSKALLHVASLAQSVRLAHQFGMVTEAPQIDMERVNQAVHAAIERIQPHDSHQRFEELGCSIITGVARFVEARRIEVNNCLFTARRFVIATGSRTLLPPIPGLLNQASGQRAPNVLTNEDLYSLPKRPTSLVILGGGAIGVEMAQAFCRLGSQVTLIEAQPELLPGMDQAQVAILRQQLETEGVIIKTETRVVSVEHQQAGLVVNCVNNGEMPAGEQTASEHYRFFAEKLLVATGRRANVERLQLENAGVDFGVQGIIVNRKMQTSQAHIYACGDVTGAPMLTHAAELEAGVVLANAVFRLPRKVNYQVVPAVVYTEPECASVGLSVKQAATETGISIHRFAFSGLDRAVTDTVGLQSTGKQAQVVGEVKILVRNGRLAGAHIVGARAGELIHELALAIATKQPLSRVATLVHAYPSYAQANKRVAGQYFQGSLFSPWVRRWVSLAFRWLP